MTFEGEISFLQQQEMWECKWREKKTANSHLCASYSTPARFWKKQQLPFIPHLIRCKQKSIMRWNNESTNLSTIFPSQMFRIWHKVSSCTKLKRREDFLPYRPETPFIFIHLARVMLRMILNIYYSYFTMFRARGVQGLTISYTIFDRKRCIPL